MEQFMIIINFNFETAIDSDWQELNRFENSFTLEAWTEDPQVSTDFTKNKWINSGKKLWIVKEIQTDRIVASLSCDGDDFELQVEKGSRKQGIAKKLLAVLAEFAEKNNYDLLSTFTGSNILAGDEMLAHIGGKLCTKWTESKLILSDINPDLLKKWIDQADHENYQMLFIEGSIPDLLHEKYAKLVETFYNTRPKDDLEREDRVITAEKVKKENEWYEKQEIERWTFLLEHKNSGELAGYSEIQFDIEDNEAAEQQSTTVLPNHRKHGLGRWLKAAMLLKMLNEKPQIKKITTGTTLSNIGMNKINEDLGFKVYLGWNAWQIRLEKLQEYLSKNQDSGATNLHKNDYKEIFQKLNLNLEHISESSIYEFAPVFYFDDGNRKAVIKRTKTPPAERAKSLFIWTRELRDQNIGVVVPDQRFEINFIEKEEETWVIYPFISGEKYSGRSEEIIAAGQMLGEIHAYRQGTDFGLSAFKLAEYYDDDFADDVNNDFNTIAEMVSDDETLNKIVKDRQKQAEIFFKNRWTDMQNLDLPYCNGIWDFKANNLIYDEADKPVLVDPDNAGRIHRLFDLALTLLLFHNELESAPARLFSVEEWQLFLKGYRQFITLTDLEKANWQNYLELVFYDEVVWLIQNDLEIGQKEPSKISANQREFIKKLLCFESGNYKI